MPKRAIKLTASFAESTITGGKTGGTKEKHAKDRRAEQKSDRQAVFLAARNGALLENTAGVGEKR